VRILLVEDDVMLADTVTRALTQSAHAVDCARTGNEADRALATGRDEGMTKLLLDKSTRRVLGAAMTGVNAGELIAEAVLALEMGADATDLSLTIHPHPTLSETLAFAAEMAEGTITDLYIPRR